MMLILLVVLWLLGVLARDDSKDSNYTITHIESCPKAGYFIRRALGTNALDPGDCYLCFCQGDHTAVCWKRENSKCDDKHYQHGVAESVSRVRRSPIGLSDIFFRDAARDLFNKQTPETCKPYESSFSEGCPPADWCVGCTVCDCDANGRWDCHILSFCPDKKDKSKLKTSKKRLRNAVPRRTTVKSASKTTRKPATRTATKPATRPATRTAVRSATRPTTSKKPPTRTPTPKKIINPKKLVKKNPKHVTQVSKPTNNKNEKKIYNIKPKKNNSTQKKGGTSPKPLIIKNDVKKIQATGIKRADLNNIMNNETEKITQEVYNKIFVTMQKFLDKRIAAIQPKPTIKRIQKRTMVKRSAKNLKNSMNVKKNVNGQFKSVANKKTKPGPNRKEMNNNKKPKHVRNKREVNDYNVTETVVVIENGSYTNIDISTILPNATTQDKEAISNITTKNSYYSYSIITPIIPKTTEIPQKDQTVFTLAKINSKSSNTTHENYTIHKENSLDEIQTRVPNSTAKQIKNINLPAKQTVTVDKPEPDFNDLKFNNWSQIKLLKNGLVMKQLGNFNSTAPKVTNPPSVTTTKPKHLKAKDVARVVSPRSKKYNRSMIVNTMNCHTQYPPNRYNVNLRDHIYSKIENLQTSLWRILDDFHKNNTVKIKLAPKSFNVIKYMKKFFEKLFRRHKNQDNIRNRIDLNTRIIDSICQSFRDCDKSKKNSLILRYKIRELNKDSDDIIRTIKIIKGLLHLLEVPSDTKLVDDPNMKLNKGKSNLKEDIRKLNAVLKDKFINNKNSLTSTQMTQIAYIKSNFQVFVQSVGKFANTLNEIISILTKNHSTGDLHALKTVKRSYDNKLPKIDTDFKRLKEMIVQYNFIQNNFVRKMYDLVTKVEKNEKEMRTKLSNENIEKSSKIDRFSRSIINNLRKLKDLAQRLNTRRQKREIMRDDDAMEYLLTLMEHLLKQNYPLDATPVNDGIDLLIEAIKTAPDIKPIKKKVLQSMPSKIRISRTTEPVPSNSLENSYSDSRKVSEDSVDNDTKLDTEDRSSFGENKNVFKYQPGKDIFELADVTKSAVYYNKVETQKTPDNSDTTVIPGTFGIFANVEETIDHNNFSKFESVTKFAIFNSDDEDEVEAVTSSTSTTMPTESETDTTVTVTVPTETTESEVANVKSKQYNENSIDVSRNSGGVKRIDLDWLDEGYEDSKEVRQTKNETETSIVPTSPLTTTTEAGPIDNISGLTREISDTKKRIAKINVKDVMFKKQMDLLNSLDYGTENVEDVESKEDDDKYSGDAFPSYFV